MGAMGSEYGPRILDAELDELFASLSAIAIDGAKAVGKTVTASQRATMTLKLDDPRQRAIVEADLDLALSGEGVVLIDEWQRLPAVWDKVRRAVDAGAPAGRFLMTGSASPAAGAAHSGAGRIVSLRMRPLSLVERSLVHPTVHLSAVLDGGRPEVSGRSEVGLEDYTDEILRSGLPGLRHLDGRALRAQLDSYMDRVVDRDFPDLGHPMRNPAALRRWMASYAAATATTASLETIRDAATGGESDKPAKTTVLTFRDTLERLFILDPVQAWQPSRNHIAELGHPPKHHLVDPALAARLVGASKATLLTGRGAGQAIPRDGTFLGALFESLVAQSIRIYAQACEAQVRHLRTHRGGHEVDLIIERDDGRVVAMEVKLGAVPNDVDVRSLSWLADQIGEDLLDAVVVTTGSEAYRRRDGIAVIPASLLAP